MNSDPPRWLDSEGGAPPTVRELLAAAPRVPPLTDAVRAQSAAHVAKLAGAGGVWFLGRYWSRGGLLGGTGAAGATGALIAALVISHPWARTPSNPHAAQPARPAAPAVVQPPPAAPPPAAPVAEPAVPAAPAVEPAPPHEAPRAAHSGAARAAHAAPPVPSTPEEEHAVIDRARESLRRGFPREALAQLRELARTYPHGQYGQERDYVTIRALAALGRNAQVRARAEAFLAEHPQGVYTSDVRAILARTPP